MHLVFQIPIIDLRRQKENKDTLNPWPSAALNGEESNIRPGRDRFIRNFGKIFSGTDGYSCSINCVKVDQARKDYPHFRNNPTRIFNIHKRLHADGLFTVKAEIGFSDYTEAMLDQGEITGRVGINEMLSHYMELPVDVLDLEKASINDKLEAEGREATDDPWVETKLKDLAPLLINNYKRSTVKNNTPQQSGEMLNGEPCITFTWAGNNIVIPPNAEKIDEFPIERGRVTLYAYRWAFRERSYKVWLFRLSKMEMQGSGVVGARLKRIRNNLFRLNAEKETVRLLNNTFSLEEASEAAQRYLKKTPLKIFRKERFSKQQEGVRQFALEDPAGAPELVSMEDLKKLLDSYGLDNLKQLSEGMQKKPPQQTVLFITSNPTDSNPIDFGEQFKQISAALRSGSERDSFAILPIATGVERDQLKQLLYTSKPDFIHITLHANTIQGLYFQNREKKTEPMPVEEFAAYIKKLTELKRPKAILICACNSLAHAIAVKEYCNYAMGTCYVFPDPAAVVYAKEFFISLFNGLDVRFSHDVAVQAIQFFQPQFVSIDEHAVHDIPQLVFAQSPLNG